MREDMKRETVPATWRIVSITPREYTVEGDQRLRVSHLDTRALGSIWHSTAKNGSWSITEALATIYAGLFVSSHGRSASVQLIVPSSVQALLITSLLSDLGRPDIQVSTAPARLRQGSGYKVLIVSVPPSGDILGREYVSMVQEVLRRDARPDADEVISVGEEPLLNTREASLPGNRDLRASGLGRFGDRGDLIRRLIGSSSAASKQLVPLYTMQDIDNISVLMGSRNWSDEKVICLCGPDVPPILAGLALILSDEADIMTNYPQCFGDEAATSKSLRGIRDFADEALLCTSGQWLLVEPQLGRGGPHRNATLLMRAASTTLFLIRFALGRLDGAIAPEVPRSSDSASERASESPLQQGQVRPGQPVQAVPTLHRHARKPGESDKEHRCRRYSDLYEKRLREVVAKLTPEETDMLLAGLEAQEGSSMTRAQDDSRPLPSDTRRNQS